MKKIRIALLGAAIAMAVALPAPAQTYVPAQGIYIDGSTNTVTVAGVATNVSYLATAVTNTFNLSNTLLAQSSTNLWPALPFYNYGIRARNLDVGLSFKGESATATNTYTWRFAASPDGTYWQSNAFSVTIVGQGIAQVNTNFTLAIRTPFISLQTEEAPTLSGATGLTNIVISPTYKPGE